MALSQAILCYVEWQRFSHLTYLKTLTRPQFHTNTKWTPLRVFQNISSHGIPSIAYPVHQKQQLCLSCFSIMYSSHCLTTQMTSVALFCLSKIHYGNLSQILSATTFHELSLQTNQLTSFIIQNKQCIYSESA